MENSTNVSSIAMRDDGSSFIVRGKRILVRRVFEEKIGTLVLPQSKREELKEGVIVAYGNEVDPAGIVQDRTCALYFDGKGIPVDAIKGENGAVFELVKDEDVLMLVNH